MINKVRRGLHDILDYLANQLFLSPVIFILWCLLTQPSNRRWISLLYDDLILRLPLLVFFHLDNFTAKVVYLILELLFIVKCIFDVFA